MKTYSLLNQQDWYEVCVDSKFPGEWVKRTDAEAEIEKARQQGYDDGFGGRPAPYHVKQIEDAAVQRERDRIVTELRDWLGKSKDPSSDWHRGVYDAAEYILTHCYKDFDRSEQKPGA